MINRQSIFFAGFVLAAIGFAGLLVLASRQQLDSQAAGLGSQLALYDRYRSILSFEPHLSEIERDRSANTFSALFMPGGTPAEASANLTGQLNTIAQGSGVQILRSSDLPPIERKAITLVGSEFEIVGQMAAIYSVIQRIEDSRPFLMIEKFAVRSNSSYQAASPEEQPVSAVLSVYAATKRNQPALPQEQAP